MPLELPQPSVAPLLELSSRLLEGRRSGTDLRTLARDLLSGFFEISLQAGLDGVLSELGVDVTDWAALAEHATFAPALAAQLGKLDLDGGGPRNAKPRQVIDSLIAALGLTVTEPTKPVIALGFDVRTEVVAAMTAEIAPALAVPQVRETIIEGARALCEPHHLTSFEKIVAQLDERGLQLVKQPKAPLDSVQAIQRHLVEARRALVERVARAAFARAQAIIARDNPEAAARFAEPVTLALTPCDAAIRRANDPRVPRTPTAITAALLDGVSTLARLSWRVPEQVARPYAASQTFAIGELIEHPKFGRGSVVSGLASRIDVQFPDGKKTLVHVPAK